jgi:hypothetical protein
MTTTDQPTAALIARGRHLVALIADAKNELEAIEAELRKRALSVPHTPLIDGHREGRRAVLSDLAECITVRFESDLLKASFDAASPTAQTISSILGGAMIPLFRLKKTWERTIKDGQKFRLAAFDSLPEPTAAALIDALKDRDKNGITKSKSTIEWAPQKPTP